MNELVFISESIGSLYRLSAKRTISLDDIPQAFRADLQNYIAGETLSIQNGKLIIGNNLYKKWISKLRLKGFDYEIDFKR